MCIFTSCGTVCCWMYQWFFVALGTTPQRREFEYPRVLSKTSPHTKIVEEFRKKYIEQEAVDTALPCESDSDEEMVCFHCTSTKLWECSNSSIVPEYMYIVYENVFMLTFNACLLLWCFICFCTIVLTFLVHCNASLLHSTCVSPS